jgi:uncharacterized protein
VELVMSQAMLDEFVTVVERPKFTSILARTSQTPASVQAHLRTLVEIVPTPPLPQPVCRDPKDDVVLACAVAASARLVVSGDDDLLTLNVFQGIPIVTAAQAVMMVGAG